MSNYDKYVDRIFEAFEEQESYVTPFHFRRQIKSIIESAVEHEAECYEEHCEMWTHDDIAENAVAEASEEMWDDLKRDLKDFLDSYR